MAEGYLRFFAGDKAIVYSAGIETHGLNPRAVAVMLEDEIDISKHSSNLVEEYSSVDFDYVITVCDHAKENCPYFPSTAKKIHHNFSDPSKTFGREEEIMPLFRKTRDEIKAFAKTFVQQMV